MDAFWQLTKLVTVGFVKGFLVACVLWGVVYAIRWASRRGR
jgi:hypothetical protein